MDELRTRSLADEVYAQLQKTAEGHCARVDFLERAEAISVCKYMIEHPSVPDLVVHVLAPRSQVRQDEALYITTDEAIEIRNRKQVRLCLFVPSDLVDAAYSSLANSFAFIDGRKLYEAALKGVMKRLPIEAQQVIRFVSRGILQASYEQRLDFAVAALTWQESSNSLGLELWRVGLIVDARANFTEFLTGNRQCTLALSRPTRPDATARERIQSLKVDRDTASDLGRFFRNRAMNDVQTWSRALAAEGTLTFDRWKFPKADYSDIRSVKIRPFINARGIVERYCRLTQPDEANGSLKALCGPRGTMVVQWTCEPEQSRNLSS